MNPTLCRIDTRLSLAGLIAAVMALTPLAASAQEAPLSHRASPEIYKVLTENELFRVVLATWKPGQRDALHSHPPSAGYALTPCDIHLYPHKDASDPTIVHLPEEAAWTQNIDHGHLHENVGKSVCRILIVERK